MVLIEVNVLVYAHRLDATRHDEYYNWLTQTIKSDSPYALSDLILSGFLRVVTHPRIFRDPTPLRVALAFVVDLRNRPNCVLLSPGSRHWEILVRLCKTVEARGNLIPDAYLAALAIESGTELITTDRDYARFSELRWRHPLEDRE